ncbi:hypothetical protein [Gordonia shandongensis]|uniref:hypothetical protein n=1 Tax=Gordonia shandongensis TaxID=376351 RepID=UPI000479ADBF|nr:hypothetical protein [Gordonia shandongensis]
MAVVDDDVVTGTEDRGRSPVRSGSRTVALVWVLILAVIAVIATLGVVGTRLYDARHDQQRDDQVLEVTRDVVAGLVSLDYERSKADLDRIKSVSTGAFQQQFDQLAASFSQVLSSGEVRSTGSVKEAGIVDADDDSASVLAAVSSVVKNTEAPDGQQRVYRMRVELERSDDDWKVSNVEFVS